MVQDCKLLIHSAEQIVQVVNNGQHFLAGNGIDEKLVVLKNHNNGGLSLIVDSSGLIAFIGPDEEARIAYQDACFGRIIDASGRCILPGLVDSHTHPVWAGDRVHEFAMKVRFIFLKL
ncbi:AMDHD1 (predicted) [Pycnogonum litorale]